MICSTCKNTHVFEAERIAWCYNCGTIMIAQGTYIPILYKPRNDKPRRWTPGDRVTRRVYMDDGTWQKVGDICLDDSPLYHGVVVRRSDDRNDEVVVIWDGSNREQRYLDHGLDLE